MADIAVNDVKGAGESPQDVGTGAPETHTMEPTEAPKECNGTKGTTRASREHTTRATEVQEATGAMGTPISNSKVNNFP